MTETSPIAHGGPGPQPTSADRSEDDLADLRATQGMPVPGVELRIADPDTGAELPWDGEASGEVQVRGPWVARSYYNDERGAGVVHRRRLAAHRRRRPRSARTATSAWSTGPRT